MGSCHRHRLVLDQLVVLAGFAVAMQRFGLLVVPQYFETKGLNLGLVEQNKGQQ
jgi:hypothetical protein